MATLSTGRREAAPAGVRVVITGGSGFLGGSLARRMLAAGELTVGGAPAGLEELILLDRVAPPIDLAADSRVTPLVGGLERMAEIGPVELVFHLAGVVSAAAEAEFDLGMATNVDGLRTVLECCRRMPDPPVLVFSSSLAVFGVDPAAGSAGYQDTVDDDTLPRPQSSYGIQKFIGEQIVADYSRKGFLRGRSVRLMTVAVRPGPPNAAASGFVSGIIREPIAGLRANCPVPPGTPIALSSTRCSVDGLLCAAGADDSRWGSRTALNLPALTTTPGDMLAALDRVTGEPTSRLVDWEPDPAVAAIVSSWPARFRPGRAAGLGLAAVPDFDTVIREYLDLRAQMTAHAPRSPAVSPS